MLISVVSLLLVMLIQSVWHPFRVIPLTGAEQLAPHGLYDIYDYATGDFQKQAEHDVLHQFGFREWLVRLYNQFLYSGFNQCTEQVVIGHDGYLFERGYMACIKGLDYIGEDLIKAKVDSLVWIDSALKVRGKHLVVMLAPNKWRFHNDKLPFDLQGVSDETNYNYYSKYFKGSGIHFLDWISGFEHLSPGKPLFAKQGTHWSIMGASRVAHMLNGSLYKRGITKSGVTLSSLEVSQTPRNTDKDLHDLLNILSSPNPENLDYPLFMQNGPEGPRALVIGDSYYWTFYYLKMHSLMFAAESKLFYYNKSMVSKDPNDRTPLTAEIWNIEFQKSKLIIFLVSEPSLKDFGWGAIQKMKTALLEN